MKSIIGPSKDAAENYRRVSVTTQAGAIHAGRIVSEDAKAIVLAINPVVPDQRRRIAKSDIATQRGSDLSRCRRDC